MSDQEIVVNREEPKTPENPLEPERCFWAIYAEEYCTDPQGALVWCKDVVTALAKILEHQPGGPLDAGYGWGEFGEIAAEQLESLIEHLS